MAVVDYEEDVDLLQFVAAVTAMRIGVEEDNEELVASLIKLNLIEVREQSYHPTRWAHSILNIFKQAPIMERKGNERDREQFPEFVAH